MQGVLYMCVHAFAHIFACVWRSEVKQVSSFIKFHLLFEGRHPTEPGARCLARLSSLQNSWVSPISASPPLGHRCISLCLDFYVPDEDPKTGPQ